MILRVPRLVLFFLLSKPLLRSTSSGCRTRTRTAVVAAFASVSFLVVPPAVHPSRPHHRPVSSQRAAVRGRCFIPTFAASLSSCRSASMQSASVADHHKALDAGSASPSPSPSPPASTVPRRSSNDDNRQDDRHGGNSDEDAQFAQFRIPASSIFYRSRLSVSFVNLRPIVPGHVLVMPRRCVQLLTDLTGDEYDDLWRAVRDTQRILQGAYSSCSAFNVAVQDGPGAGQSVPHVHVHILPRSAGDLKRNDDIYEALEVWAPRVKEDASEDVNNGTPRQQQRPLVVKDDDQRRDRTVHEMEQEAAWYRRVAANP